MKVKVPDREAPKPLRKRKTSDKVQYERFREFAREHGADDDPEAFDQRFRKIVTPKSPSS
jgi:hypothetical protein